jgi:hypothetical protein
LIATTLFDMEVEGVVASVHLAAGESAIRRLPALVQHTFPLLVPVDCFRGFAQKPAGSFNDRLNAFSISPVPM